VTNYGICLLMILFWTDTIVIMMIIIIWESVNFLRFSDIHLNWIMGQFEY